MADQPDRGALPDPEESEAGGEEESGAGYGNNAGPQGSESTTDDKAPPGGVESR